VERSEQVIADITLSLSDYGVLGGMLTAATAVLATLLLAQAKGQNRRIDVVEASVRDLEKNKADKHEWAREALVTRNKLDDVNRAMARIEGKIDTSFGVAAAVSRIAEELKKSRENGHGG